MSRAGLAGDVPTWRGVEGTGASAARLSLEPNPRRHPDCRPPRVLLRATRGFEVIGQMTPAGRVDPRDPQLERTRCTSLARASRMPGPWPPTTPPRSSSPARPASERPRSSCVWLVCSAGCPSPASTRPRSGPKAVDWASRRSPSRVLKRPWPTSTSRGRFRVGRYGVPLPSPGGRHARPARVPPFRRRDGGALRWRVHQ